jgi:hypothetical protein
MSAIAEKTSALDGDVEKENTNTQMNRCFIVAFNAAEIDSKFVLFAVDNRGLLQFLLIHKNIHCNIFISSAAAQALC